MERNQNLGKYLVLGGSIESARRKALSVSNLPASQIGLATKMYEDDSKMPMVMCRSDGGHYTPKPIVMDLSQVANQGVANVPYIGAALDADEGERGMRTSSMPSRLGSFFVKAGERIAYDYIINPISSGVACIGYVSRAIKEALGFRDYLEDE